MVRVVLPQPDGRILIGGGFSFVHGVNHVAIARLTDTGARDPTFGGFGLSGEVRALAVQSDGKIVVAGSFLTSQGPTNIARLNPNGTFDPAFNISAATNGPVWALAIQADGKILLGGDFTEVNGSARSHLARLDPTGALDPTFGADLVIDGALRAVKIVSGSQFLVAGGFTAINGVPRRRIALLRTDASVDSSFNPGAGADSWVTTLALQSDGRVLIGGAFSQFNGILRPHIARLQSDGSLDPTFDPGLGANAPISSIAVETDGRIVVGGGFAEVDGRPRGRVARFYPNGIIDPFFSPLPGAGNWVESVAIQTDGKIVIGGEFTEVNQQGHGRIARFQGGNPPPSPPLFAGLPRTFTVAAGNSLRLDAGATAFPQPSYRWFFKGMEIVGATRDTLRLQNLEGDDAGDYSVLVSNGLGLGSRQVAVVDVIPGSSEPGAPDLSFYSGTGANQPVHALALQPDGKLLIGGSFTTVDAIQHAGVARLHADGAVDHSFHGTAFGTVSTMALAADGKVLIGGAFRSEDPSLLMLAAQLTAEGEYDPAFQPLRGAGSVARIIVLPNQKVLVGGPFGTVDGQRRALVLLQANGLVDLGFNIPFSENAAIYAMHLEADNQIVVGGLFSSIGGVLRNNIARINADGTVDPTFDPGLGANGSVRVIAAQPDGKLLVAGRFTRIAGVPRLRIARLLPDGALDPTFDAGSAAADDEITSLDIENDGKILVGTTFNDGDYAIARLHPDGSIDATFRTIEFPNRPSLGPFGGVEAIEVLPDGDVLIGGRFQSVNGISRPGVARLIGGDPAPASPTLVRTPADRTASAGADVTLDVVSASVPAPTYQWQFNGNDLPGETRSTLTVRNVRQTDSGTFTVIVRNPLGFAVSPPATLLVLAPPGNPGAPDIGFYAGTGPNERVEAVLIQPDGRVLIGGLFTEVAGTSRRGIARLDRNGTVDLSFNPGLGADAGVSAIARQANGGIIVGGSFTTFNGAPRTRLARLNPDGTLDPSFVPAIDNNVAAIAIQSDGGILIGGSFTTVNGALRFGLARVAPSGALDPTFTPVLSPPSMIAALALRPNSTILAGGSFAYDGALRRNLAGFLPNGAIDTSFDVGSGPSHTVNAIAVQNDGRILVGGQFTAFSGAHTPYLLRLTGNGALDPSFTPQFSNAVNTIALQADGKIVVGGLFEVINNVPRLRLARLNSDGTVDSIFDVGDGVKGGTPFLDEYGEYGDIRELAAVHAIALDGVNTAIIAGNFTTVNRAARPYVARIYLRDAATIDTDADGLPDWWEQQYGLNPFSGAGLHGGAADFDGDARSNRTEYINGTNPVRADSIELRVSIAQVSPTVRTLRFPSLLNRRYRIFFTNDLTQSFMAVATPIVGTGGIIIWTDDGSETGGIAPNRFYKVEVELLPPP